MNSMSLQVARNAYREGKPWRVRLEYYDRFSSTRAKWWEASGDGTVSAQVNWGKIGSPGRSSPSRATALTILYTTIGEKLRGGYMIIQAKSPKKSLADLPKPYCEIDHIMLRDEDDQHHTYDRLGFFIMSLTKEGFQSILSMESFVADTDGRTWTRL